MIKVGYCLISKTRTKFFYQKDGKELEFYIDRDPSTSMAELWIRPGYTDALMPLINELIAEWALAKHNELRVDRSHPLQSDTNPAQCHYCGTLLDIKYENNGFEPPDPPKYEISEISCPNGCTVEEDYE